MLTHHGSSAVTSSKATSRGGVIETDLCSSSIFVHLDLSHLQQHIARPCEASQIRTLMHAACDAALLFLLAARAKMFPGNQW